MPKVEIKGSSGQKVELGKAFATPVNPSLLHQVVQFYTRRQRSGTASTKTRKEARGGGRKPWRQKGTGRARAGSIRSPLWRGGGVVFGPKPRDYSFSLPKKMKRIALKGVLSNKLKDGEIVVAKKFSFSKPETKKAKEFLEKLKLTGKTTVILPKDEENGKKSFRNIPGVKALYPSEINAYDVLNSKQLLFSQDSLEELKKNLEEK